MIEVIRLCLCSVWLHLHNNLQNLPYAIHIRRIKYLLGKKKKRIKIRIDAKK